METRAIDSQKSMESAISLAETEDSGYDHATARQLFEQKCSQCHGHSQVEQAPPGSKQAVIALVQRMVSNGLAASDSELGTIIRYLSASYIRQSGQPQEQSSAPELDARQAAGMTLYAQRFCIGCHGPTGKSPVSPGYPVLAGQRAQYLVQQFSDIRSGAR